MKKLFCIFICSFFIFGYTVKESKEGEGIQFVTRDTGEGAPTIKGHIEDDTLKINKITNKAGSGAVELFKGATIPSGEKLVTESIENATGRGPPGLVPIGGMVAVMSHLSGAWAPPASGFIKDGFMRADGNTVPSCGGCALEGVTLPNMVNQLAKGNATSSSVSAGSNNVAGLSGTVSKADWNDDQSTHNHHYAIALYDYNYGPSGVGAGMGTGGIYIGGVFNYSGVSTGTWAGASSTLAIGAPYDAGLDQANMITGNPSSSTPTEYEHTRYGSHGDTAPGSASWSSTSSVSFDTATATPPNLPVIWVIRVQ